MHSKPGRVSSIWVAATRRGIFALLTVLAFPALVPAEAGTFGRTTVGTIPSSGLSPDYKRGSKFTLSESVVLTDFYAYLDGYGGPQSGRQRLTIVVYRDAGGVPGPKITESSPGAV